MNNLSIRAAAKLAGISHTGLIKALKSGRLAAEPDGKISNQNLRSWLEARLATKTEMAVTPESALDVMRKHLSAAKRAIKAADAMARGMASAEHKAR